mgnify:FL=1
MENNNNKPQYSQIKKLIDSYSILDVIEYYLPVQKKGKNYLAVCPFHDDSNPSLSISLVLNFFKCFSCDAKGNAIDFIKNYKKVNNVQALAEFKKIFNIENNELDSYFSQAYEHYPKEVLEIFEVNQKAQFFYNRTLLDQNNSNALAYLKKRNIDEETISFYKIGYAPNQLGAKYLINLFKETEHGKDCDYLLEKAGLVTLTEKNQFLDFFRDRIIIPIVNENNYVVGFSGRSLSADIEPKYMNTKTTIAFKKDEVLFNFFAFDKANYEELYLAEGYMDVFALRRIGILNAVATMGVELSVNQMNLIKKYKNIQRIIICMDNDAAGNLATTRLAQKFINAGYQVFCVRPYDTQFKDIDELTNHYDKQSCLSLILDQVGFIEYQIEIYKRTQSTYKDKKVFLAKLLQMLNTFAYQELFISDDKKLISDFFGIELSQLDSLIQKKQPSYKKDFLATTTTTTNDVIWNYFEDFQKDAATNSRFIVNSKKPTSKFKLDFNNFDNLDNKNEFKNCFNKTLQNQEITLFLIALFSKQLAQLVVKHYHFIFFNRFKDEDTKKVLKVILKTIENQLESNFELDNLVAIMTQEFSENQKKIFNKLMEWQKNFNFFDIQKNNEKTFEKQKTTNQKLLDQGVKLLYKLKLTIFNSVKNELTLNKNEILKLNDPKKLKESLIELENVKQNFEKFEKDLNSVNDNKNKKADLN